MHQIDLHGLRVTLHTPAQIQEGVGHLWFPRIERMPTGELLCTYILTADEWNHVDGYGVSVSRDGGQTWLPRYDVPGYNGSCMTHIAQPDGSLGGPAFYMYPDPPGQQRTLHGTFEQFEAGGSRYSMQPWGTRVVGLPRDVGIANLAGKGKLWSRRASALFYFFGDAVPVSKGYLTTVYVQYDGDKTYTQVAMQTDDLGRTWHYLSTIGTEDGLTAAAPAVPEDVTAFQSAPAGPNESSLLRLADGDLMCVMRVGAGLPLARAYSSDEGQTWSAMDRLPAWGVAPSLWRLANGVIALSAGRPGIYLWLADDPRATRWQRVDIQAHHNGVMGPPHQIRVPYQGYHGQAGAQTTAYTEIMEVAPNRLWFCYDRTPFSWDPTPPDGEERSRVYILTLEVERR